MAAQCRTFTKGMVDKPYRGLATFFGLPYTESLDNLDIALIGVPIDLGVTDRSGTRMGPRALRNESRGVGAYNHCTRSTPCTAHRIADVGDVPFRSVYRIEEALDDISAYYRGIAAAGVTPVTAGGDHSITFPILQGLAPKEKVCLVHFDSHCDTAPPIHGCGYTHGSPMKNTVEAGLVDAEHSLQIGIRGSSEPLWEFSSASGMRVIHIEEFYEMGWKGAVKEIHDLVGDSPVYLSFDIDCLDPAFAPGTGTPVAGGMSTVEALQMVRGMQGLDVIGGDLVEVSPPYDHAGITALAGATLLFEILCRAAEARERRGA